MSLHTDLIAAGLPVQGTAVVGQRVFYTRALTAQEEETAESIINPGAYLQAKARANALAIAGYSTWTEADALLWLQTNIGTPLSLNLPAEPMTNTQLRNTIISLKSLMQLQYLVEQNLVRMIIALRDQTRLTR